jgi:hypothetical protein
VADEIELKLREALGLLPGADTAAAAGGEAGPADGKKAAEGA